MKNSIKTGIGVFILGLGIILNSCVKDKPDVPPESTIPFDPDKVLTIQDIKLIKDTTGSYTFDDIYSVYAVVGMDEESGNIYKSAFIQDETGGIQLNFLNAGGLYFGDSIRVMLQGGTVDDYGGLYWLIGNRQYNLVSRVYLGRFAGVFGYLLKSLSVEVPGVSTG